MPVDFCSYAGQGNETIPKSWYSMNHKSSVSACLTLWRHVVMVHGGDGGGGGGAYSWLVPII